jgi:hypothetical protein
MTTYSAAPAVINDYTGFRRALMFLCMLVYFAGIGTLIVIGADNPLRALLEVRFALLAFCCTAVTCLAVMVAFVRRVPVSTPDAEYGGEARR